MAPPGGRSPDAGSRVSSGAVLAPCQPAGLLCHLGGEGGETGPSPQLPPNCSLPTPAPWPQRQATSAAPVPTPPLYPTVLLETGRQGAWDASTPVSRSCSLLSPGPTHRLAQRRLSRRQRRPLRRPPGSQRCLYPPGSSRSCCGLCQLSPGRVRCSHSAPPRGQTRSLRFFSSLFIAVHQCPQKHVPPTIL